MPSLPIERGRPGPGLLAHVLVSKYLRPHAAAPPVRHLCPRRRRTRPRDAGRLGRQGRSSCSLPWPRRSAATSAPGSVLHADDTTVPVLAPGLGKTKTGRLWVVVRDERPWGSAVPPAAFYRYSPDRKGIHAEALLGTCRGFLHADGYAGFDRLYRPTTPGRRAAADRGCMLEPRTPKVLRRAPRHGLADRAGGPGADRRPVRHREQRPRTTTRSACWPRATNTPGRCWMQLKTFLDTLAQPDQRQERARRGDPLCPVAMEGADPLPRRRPARNDATTPPSAAMRAASSRTEKLSLLWLRCRRTARRLCLHHHRNRQDERHQSAGLSGRCSRTHR